MVLNTPTRHARWPGRYTDRRGPGWLVFRQARTVPPHWPCMGARGNLDVHGLQWMLDYWYRSCRRPLTPLYRHGCFSIARAAKGRSGPAAPVEDRHDCIVGNQARLHCREPTANLPCHPSVATATSTTMAVRPDLKGGSALPLCSLISLPWYHVRCTHRASQH